MDRWAEEDSDEEKSISEAKIIFDKQILAVLVILFWKQN